MGVNKKYKDSIFSFLFSNPDILRGLYGALEGIALDPDVPISINTLTDVIFKDQINDLSFLVDNRLVVLVEHQSTISLNMPLRLLKYIARVYEEIIDHKKLYGKKIVHIPWPEFIVLYNGKDPYPDQVTLKLSDAFTDLEDLLGGAKRPVDLELIATVYNINPGHNEGMLKKCDELSGYSRFVEIVRKYRDTISDKELAFKKAIDDCIEHDILREFLELHATEVLDMLLTEWKTEDALAVEREEGREEGREETLHEVLELLKQGYRAEQIEAMVSRKKGDK
ncbi:hypothetical protein AGMMS4952_16220 [Spirochaetia bacterium]|nr:hypothetical protein AGMMS4952_16220 [Spirochaetia bacterium]